MKQNMKGQRPVSLSAPNWESVEVRGLSGEATAGRHGSRGLMGGGEGDRHTELLTEFVVDFHHSHIHYQLCDWM